MMEIGTPRIAGDWQEALECRTPLAGKAMTNREEYQTTENSNVLKKAYKLVLARTANICNFCPYHAGENAFRKRKDKRSWKRHRKTHWNQ